MDREKRRRWVLTCLVLSGGLLRLAMIEHPSVLGNGVLIYSFTANGAIAPSLLRMPGYPLLLALFGGHLQWLLVLQSSLEMLGYTLLARFLWRWSGEKSGDIALGLGSLCVFTAAYSATPLPESLSVFAVMLGIWSYGQLLLAQKPGWRALPVAGAGALAMLLRPDGALLAAALAGGIVWNGRERWGLGRALRTACIVSLLAVLPLIPWTVRNWQTFHSVRPHAPLQTSDAGQPGFTAAAGRVAHMWLGPRIETLRLPVDWQRWRAHPRASMAAAALGVLGLAYLLVGAMGFLGQLVPFGSWMAAYMVARSVWLLFVQSSETRYTIEAFPFLIVGAACWIGGRHSGRWRLRPTIQAGESDLAELFAESFPIAERSRLQLVERNEVSRDGRSG